MPSPQVNVLLLSRYGRLGPSSRLRFLDFIPLLLEHGIAVDAHPFFDDAYLTEKYAGRSVSVFQLLGYYARRIGALFRLKNYDLIWLEKEALPFLPWWIEGALLSGKPYIVDFDDAWYLRYQQGNKIIQIFLGDKLEHVVHRARRVIAGNAHLESWARAAGASDIVRLPTTVDPARYHPATPPQSGRFNIGWIGSPSSAAYLTLLAPVFAELTAEPGTKLQLIGSGPVTLPAVTPEILPWREETEAHDISQFDVGVMPLRADPWSEGKCSYKLIQYMAAGLPVVASPVGMNCEVVQQGINGFLAETADEWRTALSTLRDQPELRQRMGDAGRRRVAMDYSLTATVPRLAEAIRKAALRRV